MNVYPTGKRLREIGLRLPACYMALIRTKERHPSSGVSYKGRENFTCSRLRCMITTQSSCRSLLNGGCLYFYTFDE